MTEAIILAGGLGTRLRSVVVDVPKPMAPIKGRPFLAYLMDYWIKEGVSRFILSVGYKYEVIKHYFTDNYRGVPVCYSIENKPLGTGGGILQATQHLMISNEPFLVLNGDTFFAIKLETIKTQHLATKSDITVALVGVTENSRYSGIQLTSDGQIVSFEKRVAGSHTKQVNAGIYLIEHKVFDGYPTQTLENISMEDQLFPEFLKQGKRIMGFVFDGVFIDIGVPEDYYRSANILV
jgi:D-glycero-alpha-D-manno-heptose 1-phosphate guanylyltransferase